MKRHNWSSATPGLIVFLVEQSELYQNQYCLQESTTLVNDLINHIIQLNFDGKRAKNRCYISIICYNTDVKLVTSGFLQDLDEHPLYSENRKMKVNDGVGGTVEIEYKSPLWVPSMTGTHEANMRDAFLYAAEIINNWAFDRPESPTPLVINISSGIPCYDKKEISECRKEVLEIVERIKKVENVEIINVALGSTEKIAFPTSKDSVIGKEEKYLYELSSEIPLDYFNDIEGSLLKNELSGIKERSRLLCSYNSFENLRSFIEGHMFHQHDCGLRDH